MSKNETKLGQYPIVPTVFRQIGENEFRTATEKDLKDNFATLKHTEGMSKRLYIACEAMKAMISNPNIRRPAKDYAENPSDYEKFIAIAYEYADELLKQE